MAIFLCEDVVELLRGKMVIVIGDSIQRSVYKDLVLLCQENRYLTDRELRLKGEASFQGDFLLEGGSKGKLTNGVDYQELREFKTGQITLKYLFVSRCYSPLIVKFVENMKEHPPNIIIMNSTLWDIHRYGPHGSAAFKTNLEKLGALLDRELPTSTIFIWTATLPLSTKCKGGFLLPSYDTIPVNDILEANFFARDIMHSYGFLFLDLYKLFLPQIHHRAGDGVHWNHVAHRRMTNRILSEVARVCHFPIPMRDLGPWNNDNERPRHIGHTRSHSFSDSFFESPRPLMEIPDNFNFQSPRDFFESPRSVPKRPSSCQASFSSYYDNDYETEEFVEYEPKCKRYRYDTAPQNSGMKYSFSDMSGSSKIPQSSNSTVDLQLAKPDTKDKSVKCKDDMEKSNFTKEVLTKELENKDLEGYFQESVGQKEEVIDGKAESSNNSIVHISKSDSSSKSFSPVKSDSDIPSVSLTTSQKDPSPVAPLTSVITNSSAVVSVPSVVETSDSSVSKSQDILPATTPETSSDSESSVSSLTNSEVKPSSVTSVTSSLGSPIPTLVGLSSVSSVTLSSSASVSVDTSFTSAGTVSVGTLSSSPITSLVTSVAGTSSAIGPIRSRKRSRKEPVFENVYSTNGYPTYNCNNEFDSTIYSSSYDSYNSEQTYNITKGEREHDQIFKEPYPVHRSSFHPYYMRSQYNMHASNRYHSWNTQYDNASEQRWYPQIVKPVNQNVNEQYPFSQWYQWQQQFNYYYTQNNRFN